MMPEVLSSVAHRCVWSGHARALACCRVILRDENCSWWLRRASMMCRSGVGSSACVIRMRHWRCSCRAQRVPASQCGPRQWVPWPGNNQQCARAQGMGWLTLHPETQELHDPAKGQTCMSISSIPFAWHLAEASCICSRQPCRWLTSTCCMHEGEMLSITQKGPCAPHWLPNNRGQQVVRRISLWLSWIVLLKLHPDP